MKKHEVKNRIINNNNYCTLPQTINNSLRNNLPWKMLLMVCGKVKCLLPMAKNISTLLMMAVMNAGIN